MPRINIEDSLLTSKRFEKLMLKLGSKRAALGVVVEAWIVAQRYWKTSDEGIPKSVWNLEELAQELIDSDLAEDRGDFIYVRGSKEHFGWLRKCSESGKKGGLKTQGKTPSDPQATLKGGQASYSSSLSSSSSSSSSRSPSFKNNKAPSNSSNSSGAIKVLKEFLPVEDAVKERGITEGVQKSWLQAFPDHEWIVSEIRKALAWEATNPKRRKKNFSAFMFKWMNYGWDRRKDITNNRVRNFALERQAANRAAADEYLATLAETVE